MTAREDHHQRPESSTPTLRVAPQPGTFSRDGHSYGITEYLRSGCVAGEDVIVAFGVSP
jgi:hypothetical protein